MVLPTLRLCLPFDCELFPLHTSDSTDDDQRPDYWREFGGVRITIHFVVIAVVFFPGENRESGSK